MEKTKKILMAAIMIILSSPKMNAQTYEWQKPPKMGEKELEMVLDTVDAGEYRTSNWRANVDERKTCSVEQLYKHTFDKVKGRIGDTYPDFALRQFKYRIEEPLTYQYTYSNGSSGDWDKYYTRYYYTSAIIVISDVPKAPKAVENPLSKALDKALLEVREGSKIAIDQIRVPSGTDREEYKDEVVEVLLDKGFKVVAKEYMEKLYDEQQQQQSGIYNDRTTVQENNFSAVGYYLNVKLTETALRVQVINVSTGEYEGNVTIKLQE